MQFTFQTFQQLPNDNDLPPIDDMIKIVRIYIWQRLGKMVSIKLNIEDESNELLRLEIAFTHANEWLLKYGQ